MRVEMQALVVRSYVLTVLGEEVGKPAQNTHKHTAGMNLTESCVCDLHTHEVVLKCTDS